MKTLDEYKAMLCEKAKFTLSPQAVKVSAYQVMDQMLQDFEKELKNRDDILEEHIANKAVSSHRWLVCKGAIYDYEEHQWIPLSKEDLYIIKIALNTMAEELPLNLYRRTKRLGQTSE